MPHVIAWPTPLPEVRREPIGRKHTGPADVRQRRQPGRAEALAMDMLEIRDREDVVVVSFTQAKILDQLAIDKIRDEFNDLTLQAASGRKLLLDFARVQFMSSGMIGQIVRLHKQCKKDKVKLKLCNISPDIMEVFKITGLTKLLDIHREAADALKAFGPPRRGWFR
jgi:anti-sigma B factor antagonist